jgi:energy-coupling factor transporter ATP-binding protein EcfA2
VFQLLREINASGTAVVMATHNVELMRRSDYRTIEMLHGRIVADTADPAVALQAAALRAEDEEKARRAREASMDSPAWAGPRSRTPQ